MLREHRCWLGEGRDTMRGQSRRAVYYIVHIGACQDWGETIENEGVNVVRLLECLYFRLLANQSYRSHHLYLTILQGDFSV
jgi:hypothetical protein